MDHAKLKIIGRPLVYLFRTFHMSPDFVVAIFSVIRGPFRTGLSYFETKIVDKTK